MSDVENRFSESHFVVAELCAEVPQDTRARAYAMPTPVDTETLLHEMQTNPPVNDVDFASSVTEFSSEELPSFRWSPTRTGMLIIERFDEVLKASPNSCSVPDSMFFLSTNGKDGYVWLRKGALRIHVLVERSQLRVRVFEPQLPDWMQKLRAGFTPNTASQLPGEADSPFGLPVGPQWMTAHIESLQKLDFPHTAVFFAGMILLFGESKDRTRQQELMTKTKSWLKELPQELKVPCEQYVWSLLDSIRDRVDSLETADRDAFHATAREASELRMEVECLLVALSHHGLSADIRDEVADVDHDASCLSKYLRPTDVTKTQREFAMIDPDAWWVPTWMGEDQ